MIDNILLGWLWRWIDAQIDGLNVRVRSSYNRFAMASIFYHYWLDGRKALVYTHVDSRGHWFDY